MAVYNTLQINKFDYLLSYSKWLKDNLLLQIRYLKMEKKCNGCKQNLSIERFTEYDKVYSKCIKCRTKLISKKNICEKCGIRASYNKEIETFGIRCRVHKQLDMVDVKHKKCEKCKKKRPTFNIAGEISAKYCSDCKEPDMVDILNKKCVKCKKKQPSYNIEGEITAKYCNDCKEPDMIDVKHKKCSKCKINLPFFNFKGQIEAIYCGDCKELDMIDVVHNKCKKCNIKRPTFNFAGKTRPIYCMDCKESDMIDVDTKKCEKCQIVVPVFNYETEKSPRFCNNCKEPNMVNIVDRKCNEENCRKKAIYGQPGVLPNRCLTHRIDGMMKQPRRKCQVSEGNNCKETAIYGITEPNHCEKHKLADEYCLTERKCPKCNSIDILNKQGVCINICSLVEQDLLMKKRVKKKEEFIAKLLAEEIDLKNDVIEMWRDTIIDSSCTKTRPDFAYHCGTHIVIVEVDEEQHRSYNNCGYEKKDKIKAENVRMYNIGNIFQGKPVIFIRYNPDDFKNTDGKKSKITNVKRHTTLVKWVKKCFRTKWEQGIYIKYLFYDEYDETNTTFSKITEVDVL